MTIIINSKNFTFSHDIVLVDQDKVVATFKTSMKDLPELVGDIIKQSGCKKIEFVGGSFKYNQKIGQDIRECFAAKYNSNELIDIKYN